MPKGGRPDWNPSTPPTTTADASATGTTRASSKAIPNITQPRANST